MPHHVHSNQGLSQRSSLHNLLYQNPSLYLQDFFVARDDRVSQGKCQRVFLSARRAWCDDCSASIPCRCVILLAGECEGGEGWRGR